MKYILVFLDYDDHYVACVEADSIEEAHAKGKEFWPNSADVRNWWAHPLKDGLMDESFVPERNIPK